MSIFDMLLANAMGESGGGGGSSDFSTATLTVVGLTDDDEITVIGAFAFEAFEDEEPFISGASSLINGTYTLVLYKGSSLVYARVYGTQEATITGNYDSEYQIATGDCTLTVSYTE